MHRRYQGINIPIEIVRTVVEIAEHGSFTKAGERLLLSQPAISAQIKRLQSLVGSAIFEKTAAGLRPTSKGELVIAEARRILEANDQILSLGGAAKDTRALRIGLANIYAEEFCEIWPKHQSKFVEPISIHCDESNELEKMFSEGYLDIACMLRPPKNATVVEWTEPFLWARSPQFVLSPGAPLPLVSLSQDLSNSLAVEALEAGRLGYRLVFESPDFYVRLAAVRASIGVMAVPTRLLPSFLVAAKEYYLPKIDAPLAGICVRDSASRAGIDALIRLLSQLKSEPPTKKAAS